MKSVLTSIQPYWVFLIIARKMGWDIPHEKTIEARKDCPKDKVWNNVTHIYCSKNRKSFNRIPAQYQPLMEEFLGKVIGEFVCGSIESYIYKANNRYWWAFYSPEHVNEIQEKTCLTLEQIVNYAGNSKTLYGWHISDLKIYDKPKELGEYVRRGYPNCDECAHVPCGMSPQEFVWHNKFCIECTQLSYKYHSMKATHFRKRLTRPPQSWCYVEDENG